MVSKIDELLHCYRTCFDIVDSVSESIENFMDHPDFRIESVIFNCLKSGSNGSTKDGNGRRADRGGIQRSTDRLTLVNQLGPSSCAGLRDLSISLATG